MKDLGLKLLALVIALGLALYVRSASNSSVVTFRVPVEIKNVPSEKIVLLPANPQAEVTVRGPSFLVSRIYTTPPSFKVFLPADPGISHRVTLTADQLNLPPSVKIEKIDPPEFRFSIDNRVTTQVPVEIVTLGEVSEGLRLESLVLRPERVEIDGAQSELRDVKSVETSPLDLRALRSSSTRELELRLPGKYTRASVARVQVRVNLTVIHGRRRFRASEIEIRPSSAKGVVLQPAAVDIEIAGPKRVISELKADDIIPYVHFESVPRVGDEVSVGVDLPQQTELVLLEPGKVRIEKSSAASARTPSK